MSANLLELHAREKLGETEGWEVFRYECLPPGANPAQVFRLTGSQTGAYKNGKKKWLKPHSDVYITPDEHAKWSREWSERTGLCERCEGAGDLFVSWSAGDGTKKRQCNDCDGTGKAQ